MNKLQEKRSLVRIAQVLGQKPDPALLADIARLEKIEARNKQTVPEDLNEIFDTKTVPEPVPTPPIVPTLPVEQLQEKVLNTKLAEIKTVADQIADSIRRQVQSEGTVVRPDAEMPPTNAALDQKVKYLEHWISRIAATGPGGGAASTITLDYPVTTVTTSSYIINRKDHYVGVNTAGPVTIVLPVTGVKSGRNLIIKDEGGHCSINPITLTGTIDNDTSGAILAIDNGGLHLIYNNGWRII
jgi:hypothetical protein